MGSVEATDSVDMFRQCFPLLSLRFHVRSLLLLSPHGLPALLPAFLVSCWLLLCRVLRVELAQSLFLSAVPWQVTTTGQHTPSDRT